MQHSNLDIWIGLDYHDCELFTIDCLVKAVQYSQKSCFWGVTGAVSRLQRIEIPSGEEILF